MTAIASCVAANQLCGAPRLDRENQGSLLHWQSPGSEMGQRQEQRRLHVGEVQSRDVARGSKFSCSGNAVLQPSSVGAVTDLGTVSGLGLWCGGCPTKWSTRPHAIGARGWRVARPSLRRMSAGSRAKRQMGRAHQMGQAQSLAQSLNAGKWAGTPCPIAT